MATPPRQPLGFCFGNEDKAGLLKFWNWSVHPGLNDYRCTFITDQAKGLVESNKEALPDAGHFHCSYLRKKYTEEYVRGGSQTYSFKWLCNKLMNTKTVSEIDAIKDESAKFMDVKALKPLNLLEDKKQYPAVTIAHGENIYKYQQSASSAVESMNNANKVARDRTVVDVVQ